MENLLTLPEVQIGVIPFATSLILALLLRPLGGYWSALAVMAGLILSAYVMGLLQFVPLRSTSKVLLLGLIATAVGLFIDFLGDKRRGLSIVLFIAAAAAAVWLIWPFLKRQEGMTFWLMAGGCGAYLGWLAASSETLRDEALRATTAVWVLAFATGAVVIIGASASLGQLAISLGVAAGAFCLLAIFTGQQAGSLFTLPGLVTAGLIGIAGVIFAKVPWYLLILLAAIPLMAKLPTPGTWPRFGQAVLLAMYTLPAGVVAALLSWWQSAAESSGY